MRCTTAHVVHDGVCLQSTRAAAALKPNRDEGNQDEKRETRRLAKLAVGTDHNKRFPLLFRPQSCKIAMLLLGMPLAWRATALPTPCSRSASAPRCCVPAAVVAAAPQVLMQRFMPMMPCIAKLT